MSSINICSGVTKTGKKCCKKVKNGNLCCLHKRQDTSMTEVENCTICYEDQNNPTKMKCNHSFCKVCIDKWLEKHSTCPICRAVVKERPHIETILPVWWNNNSLRPSHIAQRMFSNLDNLVRQHAIPRENAVVMFRHLQMTYSHNARKESALLRRIYTEYPDVIEQYA